MKVILKCIAGALIIGVLASCTENSNTNDQQGNTIQQVETSVTPIPEQSKFIAGVFIDLNAVKDTLFNEEIKNSLKLSMNALVSKNEEEYRSAFADNPSAEAHSFMFGKDYSFDRIITTEQDSAGRTIIGIEVRVKDGSGSDIQERNLYFYFIKDDQGIWGLRTID